MLKKLFTPFWFRLGLFSALAVIEYLATTTQSIAIVENMWDKSNHFVAFFVLYLLLANAYANFSILKNTLLLFIFALQIEVVQHFIEGRYASFADIVADGIGIALGIIAHKIQKRYRLLS